MTMTVFNRNEAQLTIGQSATNDCICTVACTIQAVRNYPDAVVTKLAQVCNDSLPMFYCHIHFRTRHVIHIVVEHSVVGGCCCAGVCIIPGHMQ